MFWSNPDPGGNKQFERGSIDGNHTKYVRIKKKR